MFICKAKVKVEVYSFVSHTSHFLPPWSLGRSWKRHLNSMKSIQAQAHVCSLLFIYRYSCATLTGTHLFSWIEN